MAQTKKYINQLHPNYRNHLDILKEISEKAEKESQKKLARAEIRGYLTVLHDAGLVSDAQFRALYCFYTLNL